MPSKKKILKDIRSKVSTVNYRTKRVLGKGIIHANVLPQRYVPPSEMIKFARNAYAHREPKQSTFGNGILHKDVQIPNLAKNLGMKKRAKNIVFQ